MAESSNGHWVGTTDAAAILGIVPRTLYRLIDEGQIPAYRLGRVIRVQRSDIDAFLKANQVKPGELSHLYPEPVESEEQE